MKKILIVFFGTVFTALLLIIIVNMSRGERIQYQILDLMKYSNIETMPEICSEYHGEVISNEEIYQTFLSDCEITATFGYDNDYFQEKIIVLYLYDGTVSRRPLSFFDYYYSVNGKEVIKVKHENDLFLKKSYVNHIYFIEMDRDDIVSGDILFD